MRLVWLTNVQAPYREPMWKELAALADFEVVFYRREEPVRHWVYRETPDYPSVLVGSWTPPLPAAVARRLDDSVAVLAPGVARRTLRGTDALVIQEWWQPAHLWAILRARLRGVPYLMYAESTLQSRQFARGPLAWIRSAVFRNAGAVVVPGDAAAEAARADGAVPERVVVTENSIDLSRFRHEVRELRADAAPYAVHRFVYVGQLIERKNVSALIRAFAEIDEKSTLDIAGDGVLSADLRALVAELGVEDRVRFLGFLDEDGVIELLARTHTLVLPSTEEVYGFTVLEAYVAGLQTIVSTRAGIAPNVAGHPGVWVVEPTEDVLRAAMAQARDQWPGWRGEVDGDLASPRRAAEDVLRAAEIACRR